jgi:hypothetical protein
MERTDLMDTKDWAHREIMRMLRKLTPDQRVRMVANLVNMGRQIHEGAMARLAQSGETK